MLTLTRDFLSLRTGRSQAFARVQASTGWWYWRAVGQSAGFLTDDQMLLKGWVGGERLTPERLRNRRLCWNMRQARQNTGERRAYFVQIAWAVHRRHPDKA